jgi:Uma2 family endonuclease
MAMKAPLFTAEDLAHLPDDGKRYELFDGELIVSPAPIPLHQGVSWECGNFLAQAVNAGWGRAFAAPIEVHFSGHRVVQPDLLFIRRERLHIIGKKHIEGAPDLVVEILSPGSRKADLGWKLTLYAQGGVPFYWVLDPIARTVRVYRLEAGAYVAEPILRPGQTLTCPLFPGISTPVSRLFP